MKQALIGIIFALFTSMASVQAQTAIKQNMFDDIKPYDKVAIIAVHNGTTNAGARNKVLEKINLALRKAFPAYSFHEAWTSRTIIRQVNANGDYIQTPTQLLNELDKQGFTHILIQPTFVTDGIEMQNLRHETQTFKERFKHIRLGEPLLTSAKDYELALLATAAAYGKEKIGNIIIFHNTEPELNPAFTMADYTLRKMEMSNWYVCTSNGVPTSTDLVRELKSNKEKKVGIIPFIFPEGNIQVDNITEQAKSEIQKSGIKVNNISDNIAEADEIIDIFVNHAKHASQYRTLTPTEQKYIEAAQ